MDEKRLKYTGMVQPQPGELDPQTGKILYPYLPSEKLVEAVNLAIALERPLLLKGEPGCGKTKLARAVAYELGLPYEAWYIKSTSRARDGFYTYDVVGRSQDAQLAASRIGREAVFAVKYSDAYVEWGPLGRAFHNDISTVVLIDDIDKAEINFPNDLLLELDEQCFEVTEVNYRSSIRKIQAKAIPIVFIISNGEKDLSDGFLRHCLFHYVQFPEPEQLIEIVKARFPVLPLELVNAIIDRFLKLREEMRKDKGEVGKKVSTSELIDWVQILSVDAFDEILCKLQTELPYPGVLLKSWDDYRRYGQFTSSIAEPVMRNQVFISYSHQDQDWFTKLQTHLKPIMRNQDLAVWYDTLIAPGAEWRKEIENALRVGKVAVLLVSPDFLASDFIVENELPPLLNAAKTQGLTIIWIPLTFSGYEGTEIEKYQAAHSPQQPLDSLTPSELNRALVDICKKIKVAANPQQ